MGEHGQDVRQDQEAGRGSVVSGQHGARQGSSGPALRYEGTSAGCKGGYVGTTTGHAGNTVALEDTKHKKHNDAGSSALFHLLSSHYEGIPAPST